MITRNTLAADLAGDTEITDSEMQDMADSAYVQIAAAETYARFGRRTESAAPIEALRALYDECVAAGYPAAPDALLRLAPDILVLQSKSVEEMCRPASMS